MTALAIPVIVSSDTIQVKQVSAVNPPIVNVSPMSEHPTKDDVNLAIVSFFPQYGIDWKLYPRISETLYRIGVCESHWYANAYNPKDTDGLPKYGALQYRWSTFYGYAKKYGVENPNIWNPRQQIEVAVLMVRDGQAWQWGCYK